MEYETTKDIRLAEADSQTLRSMHVCEGHLKRVGYSCVYLSALNAALNRVLKLKGKEGELAFP